MGAFVKFTLAAVCAVLGLYLAVCVGSGKWPAFVTVRNDADSADCALAFDDGWTWNVALKAAEQKQWLFLLGEPYSVIATCRTATRTLVVPHTFCAGPDSNLTVVIADPDKTPASD